MIPDCDTANVRPAIVRFAERPDVDVFAATVYPTLPFPLPLAPLVIVIHETGLVAVHAHAPGSVTATEAEPPLEPTDALTGAIVDEQVTPACVTVNVWPPIVTVPVRLVRAVFAAMLYATVPSAFPLPPDAIEIHDAEDVAVHAQPARVSTLTVPLVASAGAETLTGEIENVQVWPACVTTNDWPAIAIEPVRDDVLGLAATLYPTWPLPFPVAPDVTVIQESVVAAVHAHPVAEDTATLADAAFAAREALTGDSPNVHAAASCEIVNERPAIVTVPVRAAVPGLAATE